jgi:hypothetical protein
MRRAVPVVHPVVLRRLGPAAERELRERRRGDERRGAGEQLPPAQP